MHYKHKFFSKQISHRPSKIFLSVIKTTKSRVVNTASTRGPPRNNLILMEKVNKKEFLVLKKKKKKATSAAERL